jgi:hypothetical protein
VGMISIQYCIQLEISGVCRIPHRYEWHLLKANCRIFVIPAQAGGVVQGCTVYGPEDGIQEYRHH